jgi:hypothetical protein
MADIIKQVLFLREGAEEDIQKQYKELLGMIKPIVKTGWDLIILVKEQDKVTTWQEELETKTDQNLRIVEVNPILKRDDKFDVMIDSLDPPTICERKEFFLSNLTENGYIFLSKKGKSNCFSQEEMTLVSDKDPKYYLLQKKSQSKISSNTNPKKANYEEKNIIGDGRCFSGSAFYVLEGRSPRDSEELNEWIQTNIIDIIVSLPDDDPSLLEWVREYTLIPDTSLVNAMRADVADDKAFEEVNNVFYDNLQTDLVTFEGKEGRVIRKYGNPFIYLVQFDDGTKRDNLYKDDLIFLERQESPYQRLTSAVRNDVSTFNEDVIDGLKDTCGVSEITAANLAQCLQRICNRIAEKPEYQSLLRRYKEYISSLNVNKGSVKREEYEWTEPSYGPAQVLADKFETNIQIILPFDTPVPYVYKSVVPTDKLVYVKYNGTNHYYAYVLREGKPTEKPKPKPKPETEEEKAARLAREEK